MKVIEITGHQLATSGVYDTELEMTQEEFNARLQLCCEEKFSRLFSMLAALETSYTSTHVYHEGDRLIVIDTLYEATDDIDVGDTIVPGENVEPTTITNTIAESGKDAVLETLAVAENGVYTPGEGVDGFSAVTVFVGRRSPRCDQIVTFDFGDCQDNRLAWYGVADVGE